MQPVPTLPGGLSSDAVGINDLGEIVGGSDSGNINNPHAVLWKVGVHRISASFLAAVGAVRPLSTFSEQ